MKRQVTSKSNVDAFISTATALPVSVERNLVPPDLSWRDGYYWYSDGIGLVIVVVIGQDHAGQR
jgi:hypothetical protein